MKDDQRRPYGRKQHHFGGTIFWTWLWLGVSSLFFQECYTKNVLQNSDSLLVLPGLRAMLCMRAIIFHGTPYLQLWTTGSGRGKIDENWNSRLEFENVSLKSQILGPRNSKKSTISGLHKKMIMFEILKISQAPGFEGCNLSWLFEMFEFKKSFVWFCLNSFWQG